MVRRQFFNLLLPLSASGTTVSEEQYPTLSYQVAFKSEQLTYTSGLTFSAKGNPVQSLFVTRNGLLMLEGLDYTRVGSNVTFTQLQGVLPEDIVQMGYFG